MLAMRAVAKLNLHLTIGRRRPDGYHELLSLVQMVSLSDRVEIEVDRAAGRGIRLTLSGQLDCPAEQNLALRAAQVFLGKGGFRADIRLHLQKNIPAGAGLGGGSSDAAAVLRLLNHHYHHHFNEQQLHEMALKLGSDVPMFLAAGAMLLQGRGERLYPLAKRPELVYLVVVPTGWFCATAELFAQLDLVRKPADFTYSLEELAHRWLESPHDWSFVNDFVEVLVRRYPQLPLYLADLRRGGALAAGVSGSGAALWAVYDSAATCLQGQNRLRTKYDCWSSVTQAVVEPSLIEI